MKEIFNSLTEHDEQAGILKPLLNEPDLEELRQNPFHITQSNIQVKLNNLLAQIIWLLFLCYDRPWVKTPSCVNVTFL